MAHAVPERKPDGKGALTSGSGQTVEVQQLRPQGFRAFRCAFGDCSKGIDTSEES